MILKPKIRKFRKLEYESYEEEVLKPVEGTSIQELPPIYIRNSRECYLDPIREKVIYITSEETVRQRVIAYLINELNVPRRMIDVEEHLSHYGISSRDRADIVVHKVDENNDLVPILVIECKAPTVYLGEKKQMIRHCQR